MADIQQLERALVKADAAGDTEAAKAFASEIRRMRAAPAAAPSPKEEPGVLRKAAEGAALGISDIGNTVLNVVTAPIGKVLPSVAQWNRTRNADFEAITEQNNESTAFKVGRVGGNVAATLPVGGVLGAGARAAAPALARVGVSAPVVNALANALASGGFRTGAALPVAANMGLRVAAGGATGAASAALVNPEEAGTGAMIGALLPPGLAAAGKIGARIGQSARALVQPFTQNGQREIAANVVRKFGEGGPLTVEATQLVPGSVPTLAEATGNAGLAGLQRAARDLRPNAFVEREGLNAAARNAAFDQVAGDAGAIEAAVAARGDTANALYGKAFAADAMRQDLAKNAKATRAPFSGVGLSGAPEDLATPGLRELINRPMFRQAAEDAKRLAANNGVDLADPLQSLEGLHYIKLALDDALNPAAKTAMGRNASNAVMGMRNKLEEELAKVSPLYGNARQTFAEMSKPVNAMESLQGLKLTDARGNMTLAKVQNALDGLIRDRAKPGIHVAKAVSDEQLSTLTAIRDDLLRQDKLGAGRSAGSNTYQNLATDNILAAMLPGKVGGMVNSRVGDFVGQVGRLAYSGPNEKIRNALVDMMLDPAMAQGALVPRAAGPVQQNVNRLVDLLGPAAYRSAPALGTSR